MKILTAIIMFLLSGLIVMLLWNWVVLEIFGLKTISYFQSLGLYMLSNVLIKPQASKLFENE
jgi:hypothetical protein